MGKAKIRKEGNKMLKCKIKELLENITPENCREKFQAVIREIRRMKSWDQMFVYLCGAPDFFVRAGKDNPRIIRQMAQAIPGFRDQHERFCAFALLAGC